MPRLGQLLVRADLVSENNLARALGVQNFAGGRIGTLLLERGSLTEDELGKTLAQQHGCEYVPWRLLADVSPVVIAALPAKFAIKHAAVPYDRSESSIMLALRDPADLRILDELFFVTGRKIIAGVAPEVRIYQALEKYYGERRTPRYAILAEKLSRPARGTRGSSAPPPPPQFFPEPDRPLRPLPEAREIWGDSSDADLEAPPIVQSWKVKSPQGGWAGTSSPMGTRPTGEVESITWEEMPPSPSLWTPGAVAEAQAAPSPAGPAPPGPPPPKPMPPPQPPSAPMFSDDVEEEPEQPIAPAAPEPEPPSPPSPPPPAPVSIPVSPKASLPARPVPAPLGPPPSPSPEVGAERPEVPSAANFPEVSGATQRDEIGAALLAALARRFPQASLFAARPDAVAGWAAAGGMDSEIVRKITIPWSDPSVFLNVRLSRSFYLGPLLQLPRHRELADALGDWPAECVVQPVLMKQKPVAFLFAVAAGDGVTPMDLVYLRELAETASVAFAGAIRLKKKEI